MTDRTTARRIAAGVVAAAAAGSLALLGAGTASASPTPGVPYTTPELCTSGGGTVTSAGPVQRCQGGGDTGDVVIASPVGDALGHALPRPPVGSPSLP